MEWHYHEYGSIYVRLSKEDGDSFAFGKNESDSITNQKLLIQSYLTKQPEIEVVETFEDDGYTGTNFERPGFQKLLDAIRQRRIDCVVVKDFSRLGREYLEAGKYIEKVFPQMGVRFISVNDNYDSGVNRGQVDNLVVPFKNLLNEQYSRDTSGKIRSALSVKRQQGMFVGPFTVYGYLRDPMNKNHMVIDESAAEIVRSIFKMKLDGMSYFAIANHLTSMKVPSPSEHKHNRGELFKSGFQTSVSSEWSPIAVKRILTNEIYCGHMVQGKRRKISYKVQMNEYLPKEQWSKVENTHEPIISRATFSEVQMLLDEDTRICSTNTIHPLAGKVFCADCGGAMIRKTIPSGGKRYCYYVCGNNKSNKTWCSPHTIRAELLEESVLVSLQSHVRLILGLEEAMSEIDQLAWEQREIKKIQRQLDVADATIQKNQELRLSVYEDLKTGLIEKSDYEIFRKDFGERIVEAKRAQEKLRGELNALTSGAHEQQTFLREFRKYENLPSLERCYVVSMIERIEVHDKHNISIKFRYEDRFASIQEFVSSRSSQKKLTLMKGEPQNGAYKQKAQ